MEQVFEFLKENEDKLKHSANYIAGKLENMPKRRFVYITGGGVSNNASRFRQELRNKLGG